MRHAAGRRDFLKAGVGAAMATGSPWPLDTCRAFAEEPSSKINARVAATAARIMSHDTQKVHQLAMGFDMGLGEIREQSIGLLGETLDRLRVEWKPAKMKGRMTQALRSPAADCAPFVACSG